MAEFTVKLPDGREVDVDAPDQARASAAARTYWEKTRPRSMLEEATNAARSGNQFLMMGGADEYEAALGVGKDLLSGRASFKDIPQRFSERRQAAEEGARSFDERRPLAAAAAKTAYGLAPTILSAGQNLRQNAMNAAPQVQRPLLEAAKAGAPIGGLAGYLSGDANEEAGRAKAAAMGAGAGAVVAPAVQAGLSAVPAIEMGLSGLTSRFGATPRQRAVRMVGSAMREGGALEANTGVRYKSGPKKGQMRPTPNQVPRVQDRANKLRAVGSEDFVSEIGGKPLQGLGRAAANVPGAAQQRAVEAYAARAEQAPQRIMSRAARATGAGKYEDAMTALTVTGKQKSNAAYEAAMSAAESVPLPAKSMREVGKDVRDHLYDVDEGLGLLPDDSTLPGLQAALKRVDRFEELVGGGRFTLRGWERVRQDLNKLYRAKQKSDAYDAMAIQGVIKYMDRRIAGLSSDPASPYAQALGALEGARGGYGTLKGQTEAVEAGRKALADESWGVGSWFANDGRGRTQAERDGFMVGLLRDINQRLGKNDTAFIARFSRDKEMQGALRAALGERKANALIKGIMQEATRAQNYRVALGGKGGTGQSQTEPLRQDIARWTEGEDELAFMADILHRDMSIRSAGLRFLARSWDRAKRPGLRNPRVNEELSKILYEKATPDRIRALLAEIEREDPGAIAALKMQLRQAAAANAAGATGMASGIAAGQAVNQ